MIFTAIVASARARTGKTLVARLLAENFILAGGQPAIFDTETGERGLWSCFRDDSLALDLDRVTDQMALFEHLTSQQPDSRVVDISNHSFRKFFDLMRDSDYVTEARERGIEPVILYIASPDPDSFEQGRQLHEQFPDCPFVVVENDYLGSIKPLTKLGAGYRALEHLRPRLHLAALDPSLSKAIDDPSLSFSEFIRDPNPELPAGDAGAVRTWLLGSFQKVYALMKELEKVSGAAAPPQREPSSL